MPIRTEKRSKRRAEILAAAGELFAERGADAVSVADVAEAASVSRATVFNHFGSKRALLEGITEEVLSDYNAILENALASRETPVPVLLRVLFEFMGRGIEQQRLFHRAVFREIARLTLGLDEGGPGQVARQAALERLGELIERGQQEGDLSQELAASDIAMAFDSLVFGTITHWLYDDETESLTVRMQAAIDVLLAPVALNDHAAYEGPPPNLTEPMPTTGRRPREATAGQEA
jgi:AcrR family transcriptional regulator